MQYENTATLDLPFDQAVDRVREALADQGFGVLSEIDVAATLREKRGVEMEEYLILGACNPALAERALEVDRGIGVLLPCNVVVTGDAQGSVVRMINTETMSTLTGSEELRPVADEAGKLLAAAMTAVKDR